VGALALTAGALIVGAVPAGASSGTIVVSPGQSIQAAIDHSGPGGTIVVRPGTYHEHLLITKGVNIVAFGATLAPPATDGAPTLCSAPDPEDDGICIAGDITADPNTGAVTVNHYVTGVRITGLTVSGFAGSGVVQFGGQGTRFVANSALDNGEYGIAAFDSTGTTELLNRATNSSEAGFYIGDSPQANATLVGNRSSGNLFGFFIRDAEHGTLAANTSSDNCVGALFLADAPGPDGAFTVTGNILRHNDKACPASDDGPPASGIGVAILGAHDVKIFGNGILDNQSTGPSIATGGVVVLSGMGGTAPMNNHVQGNFIARNSTDIVWDGTGTGNVLRPNLCRTSNPSGLCR
jgi:nitrous oxidase accessory protein NosD